MNPDECYYDEHFHDVKPFLMCNALMVLGQCPIPVRRRPLVIAHVDESVFEVLDIISVPWEEHSRKVNLYIGLRTAESVENTRHMLILRSICK